MTEVGTPTAAQATYISLSMVRCDVPVGKYKVYVSNAGTIAAMSTAEVLFLAYSPDCEICADGTCGRVVSINFST